MRKQFCAYFVLGFVLMLALLPANVAQALTFNADMNSIKVEARPGQIINRTFQLTLDKAEQRTQFKAKMEDWWRSEDGKQSFYRPAGTLKHSCAPWIAVNPAEAAVDPGETLQVRLSIAVPGEAKPGGYWCVLTVDEVPDPLKVKPEGVAVNFLASVSVGVFVYVTPVTRKAVITEVQVLPGEAKVKVRCDGDCPLGVEGRFEFMKAGTNVPAAVVNISRSTVLPEPINTAWLTAVLPDAATLPPGRYTVRCILDIGVDHYIGVQKDMEIIREQPTPAAAQ